MTKQDGQDKAAEFVAGLESDGVDVLTIPEKAPPEVPHGDGEYLQDAAKHAAVFMGKVLAQADTPPMSTGFKKLDDELDGGLYEGLYIIGAISSLGKTTYMLQMAENIAKRGRDVIIFSLEMSKYELIAKSISRLTFERCGADLQRDTRNAKTTRGISTGKRYETYSQAEKDLIFSCVAEYKTWGRHIYIDEGIGDIGVAEIADRIATHELWARTKPVVIIDYLQIIAPSEPRATDKQNIDKAVFELKRLSREYKIPIIGISSLNRASYENHINMAAFKESGAIEYSSDVLIGMQFRNTTRDAETVNAEKQQDVRDVEIVILKNRNGRTGGVIPYQYTPMFNHFRETENGNGRRVI